MLIIDLVANLSLTGAPIRIFYSLGLSSIRVRGVDLPLSRMTQMGPCFA